MNDENSFRITALVLLVLVMLIGVYHRWQAAKTGERFDRRQEGIALAIALRLSGLAMWAAIFAYLIDPDWMAWASMPLSGWLRWTGAALGFLACGLMYWTLTNLGKNLTDTVERRTHATLVTSGPYRWVRHPFYVSAAAVISSVTLLMANWFMGLAGLTALVLLALRTPKEEQKLIEGFGEEYREYMASTGRFFPKLGAKR